ncbi:MAG: PEP-CTERM sorting domain-containing protein [Pirellulales bacterium]
MSMLQQQLRDRSLPRLHFRRAPCGQLSPVPEKSTFLLAAFGAIALLAFRRLQKVQKLIVAISILGGCDPARAAYVVVPTGLTDVEGNGSNVGPLGDVPPSQRIQQVYLGTEVTSPNTPVWITQVAYRLDSALFTTPGATVSDLQVNMSTTTRSPDGLSLTFAENIGLDEVIVRQRGPISVQTDAQGPPGQVGPFDFIVDLTTPFWFDSSAGNLLVDIRRYSAGSSRITIDSHNAQGDSISRLVTRAADGVDSPIGLAPDNSGGYVTRFTVVVPEPSTFLLAAFAAIALLAFRRPRKQRDLSLALLLMMAAGSARADYVVVPNSLTDVEGDGTNSGPFAANEPRGRRMQTVYSGTEVTSPDHPVWITQISYRLDATIFWHEGGEGKAADVQFNMSTTERGPDELSLTFAENIGPDEVIVRSRGSLSVESDTIGSLNTARPFDIVITLTTPFLFDSSVGNLLVDMRRYSDGGGNMTIDSQNGQDDSISRVLSHIDDGVNSPSGFAPDNSGAYVTRFTVVPALVGDANLDEAVDLTDFGILKANFGSGKTRAQGDFDGNGKVDLTDFGVLKDNFGKGVATPVPEPTTLLLAALGGVVLLVNRRSERFVRADAPACPKTL